MLEKKVIFVKKPVVVSYVKDERFKVKDIAEFYELADLPHSISGKVDCVIGEGVSLDYLTLVRPGGLIVLRERKDGITELALKYVISHTKKLLLRKDDEYLYFVGIKKGRARFDGSRFAKLLEFIKKEAPSFPSVKRLEDFPSLKLRRKSNAKIIVYTEERINEVLDKFSEKLLSEVERDLEGLSYEYESLAPPKDGHILQMLASGAADGQYGRYVIKGRTEVIEVAEEDPDDPERTVITQVPKTTLLAVDLERKELVVIEEEE